MSRDYGRIYTSFWTHPKIKALGRDGRELAAYLLTCEHSNAIGCYPLTVGYAAEDLSTDDDVWTPERVSEAFRKLAEKGWAHRFSTGRHVVVTEFIDPWNRPENPNVVKRMIGLFDLLPNDPLRVYPLHGILQSKGKGGDDWVSRSDRKRLEKLYETLSEALPDGFRKPNRTDPIRSLPIRSKNFEHSDDSAPTSPPLELSGGGDATLEPEKTRGSGGREGGTSDAIKNSTAGRASIRRAQERTET